MTWRGGAQKESGSFFRPESFFYFVFVCWLVFILRLPQRRSSLLPPREDGSFCESEREGKEEEESSLVAKPASKKKDGCQCLCRQKEKKRFCVFVVVFASGCDYVTIEVQKRPLGSQT